MNRDHKKKVITDSQKHNKDTGSFAVQVSIFTQRIAHLTEHLKKNKKDNHSKKGLLGMVSKRRKLLTNLKKKSVQEYNELITKLGLRK